MRKRKLTQKKTPPRYWDDSDWAIANAQMLSEQCPNQWVAIYNKKVIAHHKELGHVARQVRKLGLDDPVFTFSERGIHVYGNFAATKRKYQKLAENFDFGETPDENYAQNIMPDYFSSLSRI